MPTWILFAGIAAIAGLDACALAGIATLPALIAATGLLLLGFRYAGYFGEADSVREVSTWHEPQSAFTMPLDALLMAASAAFSFALSFGGYWNPPGQIFDEVYFARAAEEYLRNQSIYESTHPPLAKLIITLSVLLFGGLPHGDTAIGWRFLDVTFSSLAVAVLYALARRITGSPVFATLAALFFTLDGMHFVQSRIATPEGIVVFFSLAALYAVYRWWLLPAGIAIGALIACKWYGVTMLGVAFLASLWRKPKVWWAFLAFGAIAAGSASVYALSWTPDLIRQSPDPQAIHSVGDVVAMQRSMYDYHSTLRTGHPYSSKWWEWPLDAVPVAYYYHDSRADSNDPGACCVAEITSMPNPVGLWLGLLSVPVVGILAWRERNRGYALIVAAYLLQWLPWSQSPRVSWEYHFYVDVPIVALCNAIALQRLFEWARSRDALTSRLAGASVAVATCAIAAAFVYFYPILSAVPISWDAWHARMWFPTWIIGPG